MGELANFNGVGGRHCRSNWCHDRDAQSPVLAQCFPSVMVAPFKTELAEARCIDVPVKNLEEFKAYMQQCCGPDKRFLDPQYPHSGPVRLHARSQEDIMYYIMHYIARDSRYDAKFRNCQF